MPLATRRIDQRLQWRERDDKRPLTVLAHVANHARAAQRREQAHDRLADDRHAVEAAAPSPRDDQHLASLGGLTFAQPQVGTTHRLRAGRQRGP